MKTIGLVSLKLFHCAVNIRFVKMASCSPGLLRNMEDTILESPPELNTVEELEGFIDEAYNVRRHSSSLPTITTSLTSSLGEETDAKSLLLLFFLIFFFLIIIIMIQFITALMATSRDGRAVINKSLEQMKTQGIDTSPIEVLLGKSYFLL